MMIEKAICDLQSNITVMCNFERKSWVNGLLHPTVLGGCRREFISPQNPHAYALPQKKEFLVNSLHSENASLSDSIPDILPS